eukprot:2393355-Pyramimonas_sp.AAC.1
MFDSKRTNKRCEQTPTRGSPLAFDGRDQIEGRSCGSPAADHGPSPARKCARSVSDRPTD